VAGALPFRRANGTGGSSQQLQLAVELRHQRCTLRRIARLLLVPISTLARAMRRLGLNRLRNLDPKPPVQRYQWERPGDMIHVDIKQLARFNGQGIECRRVLSDNGSAYKSHGWRNACHAMGLKVKKTRPYTPRTNGKAERYGLRPTSSTSRHCWRNGPT
jgi:hypothetical protein